MDSGLGSAFAHPWVRISSIHGVVRRNDYFSRHHIDIIDNKNITLCCYFSALVKYPG